MKIHLKRRLNLKPCPICNSIPLLSTDDMGQPNGRGYTGDFMYYFYCPFCQKLDGNGFTTIYAPTEKCIEEASNSWNEVVDKMKNILNYKAKR